MSLLCDIVGQTSKASLKPRFEYQQSNVYCTEICPPPNWVAGKMFPQSRRNYLHSMTAALFHLSRNCLVLCQSLPCCRCDLMSSRRCVNDGRWPQLVTGRCCAVSTCQHMQQPRIRYEPSWKRGVFSTPRLWFLYSITCGAVFGKEMYGIWGGALQTKR